MFLKAMLNTNVIADLQRELDWLRRKAEERYGRAVWDVRCHFDLLKSHVVIKGHVLLRRQKSALQRIAANLLGGATDLKYDIEVIADTASSRKTDAGKPRTGVLNVYSRPLDCFSLKIKSERFLSTQVMPSDHTFHILFEHKDWFLVHLKDGSLGWAQKQSVELTGECAERSGAATSDGLSGVGKDITLSDSFMVVETAREYLGTRYVLGGATKFGIDCSGLAQRVYKDALDIVLPKHTRDQLSAGQPILFGSQRPGDLVFFKARNSYGLHVGLVCAGNKVIHASRRNGLVTMDEITTLASTLDIIGLRRIDKSSSA